MGVSKRDSLKLKAAVEFGSDYIYTVKEGGLGPTLVVDATTRQRAHIAREKIPTDWEGLYVIVVYNSTEEDEEFEDWLSEPKPKTPAPA